MRSKAEATAIAAQTARLLGRHLGLKWRPKVTENLGWHARAVSSDGRWHVHPLVYGGRIVLYTAFLNSRERPGGRWAESGDTPQQAVDVTRKLARAELRQILSILDPADTLRVLKGFS